MENLDNIIKYSKQLNLLYVEDNEDARVNSLFIFEEFFNEIFVAVDGEDGFELFSQKQESIDIIITDINMPRLNGLEMLEKIREIDKQIPVLVLSAYNESNFFMESIKLDVDGYLLKPIDLEQFLSTLSKVVEKVKLKKEAQKNLNFLHQYQEATDASTIVSKTDVDGVITYVNDEFCKVSGYSKKEVLGKTHALIKSNHMSPSDYAEFWDTIKNKKEIWQGTFKNVAKNGSFYYLKTTVKPILDEDGNIIEFIALTDDITDVMNQEKQFTDLYKSLDEPMVVLLKIEDFDDIYNYYGQALIEEIEQSITQLILEKLPAAFSKDKFFRLGQGEYGFVKTLMNSHDVCEGILKDFQNDLNDSVITIEGVEYNISILISFSFGKDALDNAKYGLKELENSHNIFISATNLSDKMHKEADENIKTLKMIKSALADNRIVSYFQPIVDNRTKEVVKYESLVRLIDEEDNVISPFFFLERAKKGKYYNQITHRVLENSFAALKQIKEDISINVSSLDIEKKATRDKILELLRNAKEDAKRVTIELLEDEEIRDIKTFKAFISDVKNLGVKIAVDDFGSGYSNFERLLDYEPDILKIDGSLVKHLVEDRYSRDLVDTIAVFAYKQNMEIIAEFVENEEVFQILDDIGVQYTQGYLFGKPMPLSEIVDE